MTSGMMGYRLPDITPAARFWIYGGFMGLGASAGGAGDGDGFQQAVDDFAGLEAAHPGGGG